VGILISLGLVAANDRTGFLPVLAPPAEAYDGVEPVSGPGERTLLLEGGLPPGARVLVDGRPVEAVPETAGLRVPLPPSAASGNTEIAVRNELGTLWTTRLAPEGPEVLSPVLGGDIVVEIEGQASGGELLIDGVPVGAAPGTASSIPAGWHLVGIRDGEALLYQEAVFVLPGEVRVVSVPPPPPRGKGSLNIRSRLLREQGFVPSERDRVTVDGAAVGETPLDRVLEAGFHSVAVHRAGFDPVVQVLYLPAGQTRFVEADFGREDLLRIVVTAPPSLQSGAPGAVPVTVDASGESVQLTKADLMVLSQGQSEPIVLPMAPAASDPRLWVAVVPAQLVRSGRPVSGYAVCVDDRGRTGSSEIFTIPVP
jgi:hypothetical protein